MTTARRKPTTRFPSFVAGDGDGPDAAVDAARELAGGVECVLWVHESVHDAWGLPASPGAGHAGYFAGAREMGAAGWLICEAAGASPVHVAFPRYCGDFAGTADPIALGYAVESWRAAVGIAYLFSGPSTVHALIRSLERPHDAEPEPEVNFRRPAWAVPVNSWGLGADSFAFVARRRGWVRCFDRSGSYLAAWSGLRLGDGEWTCYGGGELAPGPESQKWPGYWLVDRAALPSGDGLFDPFRRHNGDDDPGVWLTTPLAQLAVELADAPIPVLAAWVQTSGAGRPLDRTATRLREARAMLDGPALDALKVAYSGATAWFEHGPKSGPLARPHWGRSIIDRAIANTYRSLRHWTPCPVALADIDTAIVVVDGPDELPDGMRAGTTLGAWKPKGRALRADEAVAAYEAGGARAVVKLTEAD